MAIKDPINYPTSLDSATDYNGTDKVDVVDHASMHSGTEDALVALETKLGTGDSTATDNKVLTGTGAGTSAWATIDTNMITNTTGSDTNIVTGTAGSTDTFGVWNADGDVIGASVNADTPLSISSGAISIDGDKLDIDWSPTSYTPDSSPSEADDVADLTAHLKGIDTVLGASSASSHTQDFTAGTDLTAGDMVGISFTGGTVGPAFDDDSNHSIATPDTYDGPYIQATPISGDKFFMIYEAGGTMSGVIGTIDTTDGSMAFGSSYAITTDCASISGWTVDICTIGTDKVAISYLAASDSDTDVVVCTVSGTVITAGTPVTAHTGTTTTCAIAKLDTDKLAVYAQDSTPGNSAVYAATVSGTVPSFGSGDTYDGGKCHMVDIGTDKVVLFGQDLDAVVATVSTTTVTVATPQASGISGSADNFGTNLVSDGTDKFLINCDQNVMACTVSGTTITFGTEAAVLSGTQNVLGKWGTNTYVLSGSSSTSVISVSGTTITSAKKLTAINLDASSERNCVFATANGEGVLLRASSTTTIDYFYSTMSGGFIGFAQSSVSQGQTVSVMTKGHETNQSGLITGATYRLGYGNAFSAPGTTGEDTFLETRYATATSATSIVF